MNANEVIESYIHDVARRLPRSKRNDIARELRSLLSDELTAIACSHGRAPDADMAVELVRGFGRPAEAAGRYHQPSTLVDPADTHHFLIWSLGGAITLGILSILLPNDAHESGDLFLKWLGALVVIFAALAWWRRRPTSAAWKPKRVKDLFAANRCAHGILALLTLLPLLMYTLPQGFARVVTFGAAPTHGLAFEPSFENGPIRIATLVALVLHTGVYAWIAAEGRWQFWTRWMSMTVLMAIGLLSSIHAGLARQALVFSYASTNEVATPMFALVGTGMILSAIYAMYVQWSRIEPATRSQPAVR